MTCSGDFFLLNRLVFPVVGPSIELLKVPVPRISYIVLCKMHILIVDGCYALA
jgi:hypothetical protein